MAQISIREIQENDKDWIRKITKELFGADYIFDGGNKKFPYALPGFIAFEGNKKVGIVTLEIIDNKCEIVTIESLKPKIGIGSRLLEVAQDYAKENNCNRIWLVTTNDNLNALKFYQKRGYCLVKIYRNAVTEGRKIKPEIPLVGESGIPIRDEIELEILF